MKITGNSAMTQLGQTAMKAPSFSAPKMEKEGSFDQITFESRSKLVGEEKMLQETATRISQEVRTHNPMSKIAELKEAVQNGTYQMDARETAARMLLMGEVE